MVYSIPNHCHICNDTLLGPPPPSALVIVETDVHNRARTYHKSCIERLARIAKSLNDHGPFYGAAVGSDSDVMQAASRPQLQYNKDAGVDDDTHDVRSTPPTGYLRTPYTNETFDDHRDKVIEELRAQVAALSRAANDGPTYIAQAVRVALRSALDEYRNGKMHGERVSGAANS
jgi:hypothetical protein